MKSFFLSLFLSIASISLSLGQTNSTGGSNYYTTANLYGQAIESLTGTGGAALVWVDMAHGNDGVVDGLTARGYAVTVATSGSNFNTLLQTGGFNLAVLFVQYQSASYQGISPSIIRDYIESGRDMIFATWSTSDASIASIFDVSFSGNTNLSIVTVTDPAIASGITNPFTLSNPSWGVFSMGLIANSGAEVLATFENGNAAIVRSNGGRTIMLGYLSDAPASVSQRQLIFENVFEVLAKNAVPFPIYWILAVFVLIAAGVVISKRKVIFS
jgi:hypothetical protein